MFLRQNRSNLMCKKQSWYFMCSENIDRARKIEWSIQKQGKQEGTIDSVQSVRFSEVEDKMRTGENIQDVRPVPHLPRQPASVPKLSAMFLHFHENFPDTSTQFLIYVCVCFLFQERSNHKLSIYIFCFIILMIKKKKKQKTKKNKINICLKGQTVYF